jgi:anti-sigma factor RsiW
MNQPALPFSRSGRCCSDLRLDQLLCGELDDDDAHALRVHLQSSPRCADRLAALDADRAAFVAEPPPLRIVDDVPGEATAAVTGRAGSTAPLSLPARTATLTGRPGPSVRRVLALVPALAAAAAAGVVLLRTPPPGGDPGVLDEVVRTKGDAPQVVVHARRGDAVFALGPGDVVRGGDALRIDVATSEPGYVGVVGVDHDGVTAWIPAAGDALAWSGGPPAPLPTAVALDAAPAPGTLRIVVWSCPRPIAMAMLVAATTSKARPDDCAQETLTLQRAGGPTTP